jgi:hypothetical protein
VHPPIHTIYPLYSPLIKDSTSITAFTMSKPVAKVGRKSVPQHSTPSASLGIQLVEETREGEHEGRASTLRERVASVMMSRGSKKPAPS